MFLEEKQLVHQQGGGKHRHPVPPGLTSADLATESLVCLSGGLIVAKHSLTFSTSFPKTSKGELPCRGGSHMDILVTSLRALESW